MQLHNNPIRHAASAQPIAARTATSRNLLTGSETVNIIDPCRPFVARNGDCVAIPAPARTIKIIITITGIEYCAIASTPCLGIGFECMAYKSHATINSGISILNLVSNHPLNQSMSVAPYVFQKNI
jgi:hypothetical protein